MNNTPNLTFELESSTNGPNTRKLVKKWVDGCSEHHQHCGNTREPGFFPTRLIAIQGNNQHKTFRLIKGTTCTPGSLYCTLSHCWGSHKPVENKLRLLQTTADQLAQEQSIDVLPRTFRDAIEVALRFGANLLWIDSLCIYQDSADDWRAEAATMQQVYKNSHLSISALGAEDDDAGLFFDRDPAQVGLTVVLLKSSQDDSPRPYRFELEKGWAWRLSWSPEPIISRGWVVQERLLPARVLHFGSKQVFWECREQNACEVHPETVYCSQRDDESDEARRLRAIERSNWKPHLWKQLLDAPDRRSVEDPYLQLFVDWNAILHTYSEAKLTVPTDKLVALSGLAKDMKQALDVIRPGNHRYLAGLWEEQLREGLCWSVNDRETRPSGYRAPSWSFAAIDGRTTFPMIPPAEQHQMWMVDECSASTELLGTDDTAEVSGGELTLRGRIGCVYLGDVIPTGISAHPTSRIVHHWCHPVSQQQIEPEPGKLSNGRSLGPARVMFDAFAEMPDEAFCVPIQARSYATKASEESTYALSALVLLRVGSSDARVYRRVGFLSQMFASGAEVERFFGAFPREKLVVI
ncbi:HET-domain-containing protein [Lophiostoma macrostomum CBS 122681]|uniref:HET-domain-containing protein n=1 Tax=Lophiostoma macrostomum CBS 122681 TaxID=1314788 RepID=A0A6A6SPI1_9PLEO|nr:HET-domain-containing protein [Lophiostoma macrostomum CBS 122681]